MNSELAAQLLIHKDSELNMERDDELRLQAYLDGELPEAEAREVAKWLAQDQQAVLLHAELKNTRQSLAAAERPIQLPESREFFWSKIERKISRLETTESAPKKESFLAAWRRLLVPVGAVAALGIIILAVLGPLSSSSMAENEVTSDDDSGGFVYRDDSTGTTMVWLSYPAENEVADTGGATKL